MEEVILERRAETVRTDTEIEEGEIQGETREDAIQVEMEIAWQRQKHASASPTSRTSSVRRRSMSRRHRAGRERREHGRQRDRHARSCEAEASHRDAIHERALLFEDVHALTKRIPPSDASQFLHFYISRMKQTRSWGLTCREMKTAMRKLDRLRKWLDKSREHPEWEDGADRVFAGMRSAHEARLKGKVETETVRDLMRTAMAYRYVLFGSAQRRELENWVRSCDAYGARDAERRRDRGRPTTETTRVHRDAVWRSRSSERDPSRTEISNARQNGETQMMLTTTAPGMDTHQASNNQLPMPSLESTAVEDEQRGQDPKSGWLLGRRRNPSSNDVAVVHSVSETAISDISKLQHHSQTMPNMDALHSNIDKSRIRCREERELSRDSVKRTKSDPEEAPCQLPTISLTNAIEQEQNTAGFVSSEVDQHPMTLNSRSAGASIHPDRRSFVRKYPSTDHRPNPCDPTQSLPVESSIGTRPTSLLQSRGPLFASQPIDTALTQDILTQTSLPNRDASRGQHIGQQVTVDLRNVHYTATEAVNIRDGPSLRRHVTDHPFSSVSMVIPPPPPPLIFKPKPISPDITFDPQPDDYWDALVFNVKNPKHPKLTEFGETLLEGKLCLVIDFDNVLISTTRFSELDAAAESLLRICLENEARLPFFARSLHCIKSLEIWVKLRPGLNKFLKVARNAFWLYAHTTRSREEIEAILQLIDPEGCFFKHRIVYQERAPGECIYKKVNSVGPALSRWSSLTFILADSCILWEEMDAVFGIESYTFFPETKAKFGLSSPSMFETRTYIPSFCILWTVTFRDEEDCGFLLNALGILLQLRRWAFTLTSEALSDSSHEDNGDTRSISKRDAWDVRKLMLDARSTILPGGQLYCRICEISADVHIYFDRVFSPAEPHDQQTLWRMAASLGATCSICCTDRTTHVVTLPGSSKVTLYTC